jgi:co-chaperonin GroES (HSP10)
MNYIPMNRNIIVRCSEGSKVTESGIVLQNSQEQEIAIVIATASDVDEVSVGDRVLVHWPETKKLELNTYKVPMNNVLAVYEE